MHSTSLGTCQPHVPSRWQNDAEARRRFGGLAARFAASLLESDELADSAARELASAPAAGRNALLALVRSAQAVPPWVDRAACDRGGALVRRHGLLSAAVLGYGSLAGSYCSPAGNKPLVFTGQLIDDTRARLQRNVSEDLALEALAFRLERLR